MCTDFHAKYAKRRDSAHGCVFWGLQNQYLKFYSPFTPKTTGNLVWYCQSKKAKVTLWSVDLIEGLNCWNML